MKRDAKHLRDIVAFARSLGVTDTRIEQGGKHPCLVGLKPDGGVLRYILAGSPSDGARGEKNTKADLGRAVDMEREKGLSPHFSQQRSI